MKVTIKIKVFTIQEMNKEQEKTGKTYSLTARKTQLTKDRCMLLQSIGRNRQHFYGIVHDMLKQIFDQISDSLVPVSLN